MSKRNTAGTYAGFAESEADEPRGRFGAITKARVTGSTELVGYPAGASWTRDTAPDEPPLGLAVEQVDPVGEHFEIQASLGETHPGDVGHSSLHAADSALPGEAGAAAGAPSGDDEQLASPPSKRRKRR